MAVEEHFAIRTTDGITDLRGQVDFPDSSSIGLPLLVVVSGGGPQDRDGYFGNSGTEDDLVYRQISRAAVESEFAVLRWDYRGVKCNEMTMPPCEGTNTELERAKQYCKLCLEKVVFLDYKDEKRLGRFVTDRGKIVPRRVSGTCARHQKQLTTAIKRARILALLPFSSDIYR